MTLIKYPPCPQASVLGHGGGVVVGVDGGAFEGEGHDLGLSFERVHIPFCKKRAYALTRV